MDFHAHILPGADHGSRDLDHSLRQLRAAKAVGVDTIVATPLLSGIGAYGRRISEPSGEGV